MELQQIITETDYYTVVHKLFAYDGADPPPYVDEDKDVDAFATNLKRLCPDLKEKVNLKIMTQCLRGLKKNTPKKYDEGSFTIQCACRISITNFVSIFSGKKCEATEGI